MLYDFHKSQNDRRPGAIHATYLVYGTKRVVEATNGHAHEDGDVEMTSSMPETESVAEEVTTHTLTLVSEEQLQGSLFSIDIRLQFRSCPYRCALPVRAGYFDPCVQPRPAPSEGSAITLRCSTTTHWR